MPPWDMIIGVIAAVLGSSALTELIKWLIARKDTRKQFVNRAEFDVVKMGQMYMLQNELRILLKEVLDKGYIEESELQVAANMHEIYNKEGGNSFIEDLYERAKKLPIK